jgi:hypothetical protein
MKKHTDTTPESKKMFEENFSENDKVTMLNLVKFRKVADYTGLEHLKPEKELSGEDAYQLLMNKLLPHLTNAGAKILYYGKSKHFLIGPESEKWDAVVLVEHLTVSKFKEFSQSQGHLQNAGHRTAALEDYRLLPLTEMKVNSI